MKTSLYNTYLPFDNNTALLYNALSDKYIVLRSHLLSERIHHLEQVTDSSLLEQLKEIGAIVPVEMDEVTAVRDLIQKNDHNNHAFQLHINPTVDCNFRCWYCYEEHHKSSRMSIETVQAIIKFVKRTIDANHDLKIFHLSFFGGEPLMGFNNAVKPLILAVEEACKNKDINYTLHFTTNGALLNERMLKFFSTHTASFQITLDGHRAHHDKVRFSPTTKEGSYDKIIHNILELAKRKCKVLVRVNYTTENLHTLPEIIADFGALDPELKRFISFDLQHVWQDIDRSTEYTVYETVTTYIKELNEQGFITSFHGAYDQVRNSCYGDKRNYLLVNYDGGVFLCTARDFDDAHRAGSLMTDGSIQWRNNAQECRLSAKFSKPVCHTCRIAPLCGGGCCTQALEHTDPNVCMYRYTDTDLDRIIATRFEQLYMM